MASTFSIADILADVAKLSNSPPFTATTNVKQSTALYWIAQSARSLSALLHQHHGADREFVQTALRTTSPGYGLVSLPDETSEVHSVLWQRGERDYVLLETAGADDLAPELEAGEGWDDGAWTPRWRLEGNTIAVFPTSDKAEVLEIYYTTHLGTGTGTFQARLDFDRWVTLDVCAKVATAKRRDAGEFMQQRALLENDLLSRARKREPNAVHTMRDTRGERALADARRWWGWR